MNQVLKEAFLTLFASEAPEIPEGKMAELLIKSFDGGKLGDDLAGKLLAYIAGNVAVSEEVRLHACALITEVDPEQFSPAKDDPSPTCFERWIQVH